MMHTVTLVILYFTALVFAYFAAWRWLNRRFGYTLPGAVHCVLFIFLGAFVVIGVGIIYLITYLKDKSAGKTGGGNNEIDI